MTSTDAIGLGVQRMLLEQLTKQMMDSVDASAPEGSDPAAAQFSGLFASTLADAVAGDAKGVR